VSAAKGWRSLSVQITAALLAGLAAGLLASSGSWPAIAGLVTSVEPVGTLWINLIRMVVIPLVVAALISGVLGLGGIRRLGRVGMRTLAFFWATSLVAIAFGLILSLIVMPLASLPAETAAALRSAAASGAGDVVQQLPRTPSLAQFFVDLVPTSGGRRERRG
jgi:Na+/H+-dicarboxylate symporter